MAHSTGGLWCCVCVCAANVGPMFSGFSPHRLFFVRPSIVRSVSRTGPTWPVLSQGHNRGIEWAVNCLWALIKHPKGSFTPWALLASSRSVPAIFKWSGSSFNSPRFGTEGWTGFQLALAWHCPVGGTGHSLAPG